MCRGPTRAWDSDRPRSRTSTRSAAWWVPGRTGARASRARTSSPAGSASRPRAPTATRWRASGGAASSLFDPPPAERGLVGAGTIHHIAWACDDGLPAWRQRVIGMGCRATPVIDRGHVRSIYFREPSGVLFEIATRGRDIAEPGPRPGGRGPSAFASGRPPRSRRLPARPNLPRDRGGSDRMEGCSQRGPARTSIRSHARGRLAVLLALACLMAAAPTRAAASVTIGQLTPVPASRRPAAPPTSTSWSRASPAGTCTWRGRRARSPPGQRTPPAPAPTM